MLAKTVRACAATSSPPTSSRLASTGTIPLTKSSSPAWTASVKCEIGSAWPSTRNSRRVATAPTLATTRQARWASAIDRAASSASAIVSGSARSPTITFTWKSRWRRVSCATAPRPAKHSNVPRRSFIPESGRKPEVPIESRHPITTMTAPVAGTRYDDTWQSLSTARAPSVPTTRSVWGSAVTLSRAG